MLGRESTPDRPLGSVVYDDEGRRLGTVKELVVDRDSDRLVFALVAIDGGDPPQRYLPVPWRALVGQPEPGHLTLPMSSRFVAAAPVVAADRLEELDRREVTAQVFSYYGVQPPWERLRRPPAGAGSGGRWSASSSAPRRGGR